MKKIFKKLLAVMSAGIIAAMNYSAVTVSAETENLNDKLWIVEYLTGKDVIYTNGKMLVFEDGELQNYGYASIEMNYVVSTNDEELTLEKLGLSDKYNLEVELTDWVNEIVRYRIVVPSLEEAEILYDKAEEISDNGVFLEAYSEASYVYGCYRGGEYILKLKDAEAGFDFSCIENYENMQIIQSETDASTYQIRILDGFDYINVQEAYDTIIADENVESFENRMMMCCVAHIVSQKKDVTVETEDITIPTANPTPITLAGDLDLDNDAGLADIVILSKYNSNAEIYPISDETARANADVNRDGVINSLDINILIEQLLGSFESAV